MRLTNSHRNAFVIAVLNDIPQIDYNQESGKVIDAYFAARCPKDVLAFEKKYPGRLRRHYVSGPGSTGRYTPFIDTDQRDLDSSHPDLYAQLLAINEEARAQDRLVYAVRDKLSAAIKACNTVKQARERLPEFEKYLPVEAARTKDLPAVTNLVADLSQLGWPKGDSK